MLPLRDLQGAMAASVLQSADAPLAPFVRADGIAFDGRVQVYRNNTFSSLTAALKDSFPVVCQLVDERFFGYAAQDYIRAHPRMPRGWRSMAATSPSSWPASSRSATSPPAGRGSARMGGQCGLPRRGGADARSRAHRGRAAGTLSPADVYRPSPPVRLFASEFPVDRIWQAHQPGGDLDTKIDLTSEDAAV